MMSGRLPMLPLTEITAGPRAPDTHFASPPSDEFGSGATAMRLFARLQTTIHVVRLERPHAGMKMPRMSKATFPERQRSQNCDATSVLFS